MPRFNVDDYIPVQDRINTFWEKNPDGAIRTKMISNPDTFDRVVFRADVFKTANEYAEPDATGWASEVAGKSPSDGANFTSWHENAETSAIGRALANMGYATSAETRMTREEADKANRMSDQGGGRVYQNTPPNNDPIPWDQPKNGIDFGRLPPPDKPRAPVTLNADGKRMPTPGQVRFLEDLLRERDMDMIDTEGMTFDDASQLIEQLKAERPAKAR